MNQKIAHYERYNLTASSYVHSFLITTKHLRKIRLHMIFTVLVNSLKSFFILTVSKNIKIHKTKF